MGDKKRPIDANSLLEKVQFRLEIDNPVAEIVNGCVDITRLLIENEPTVDAVEVVRCKDCKWRTDCDFYNKKGICVNRRYTAGRYGLEVPEQHFCSFGERKDDEKPSVD